MKSIELLFLVMFILIIYLVLVKDMDSNMIMAMAGIWFVVLWIGWDNMGAWKNNDITQLINTVNPWAELPSGPPSGPPYGPPYGPPSEPPSGPTSSEPPFGLPASDKTQSGQPSELSSGPPEQTTEQLYAELGCDSGSIGDNLIAKKMKQMSGMNKVAIDSYRKQNKNTNMNYFIEELKNHANSVWWDDETLENEF